MNRYGARGQRLPQRRGPTPPPRAPGLGAGYLKNGYFDGKGNIWPELIVDEAKRVADVLGQRRLLKTSQLRRFFGKARNIQQKLESGQPFDALVSEIRGMQPLAANAVARGNAPEAFKEFIDRNVPLAARDAKHFVSGFLAHFQGVLCYFTYLKLQRG